jgi:hypothetical protein
MKIFLLSLVLLQQNAMMLVPSSPCFFLPPSRSNPFPARALSLSDQGKDGR